MQIKKFEFHVKNHPPFTIFYENYDSLIGMIDEIFEKKEYYFKLNNKQPFIIDAGSNIGLTTLYFKYLYPQAHVVCFEPDPSAFDLLKKNISINNIQNVQLINKALFNMELVMSYFGQIHTDSADSRGNSLFSCWGKQRISNEEIKIQTCSLSPYIVRTVDLLKLDVEAAEELVLHDLAEHNCFNKIKNIIVEVHVSNSTASFNSLERIINLLNSNFDLKITHKADVILPKEISTWVDKENPKLYVITAINKSLKNDNILSQEFEKIME